MPVRPIIRMGNPLLRQVAREITPSEIGSDWLTNLILDMDESMAAAAGLGIAAPQIGESVRVSIIKFDSNNPRYSNLAAQPRLVFINPKIEVTDAETQEYWEGCLSVPGLRGLVPRPRGVKVNFLDEFGKNCSIAAEGFLATVFQHEFDHLDGLLYVDRIKDLQKFAFIEEYQTYFTNSPI